ncbi:MAG: succinate dehydrogenase assembly factor 2 [Pseudomonadota bacterium]
MIESHEHRIKRLKMRSMRRGIKEMDLILQRFADGHLDAMSDTELTLYDGMLNENDHDLYQWVTGQSSPPETYRDLIARIIANLPETSG